ncbi:MAG: 30S ribosome-binding factor RbfA [Bacteroidales bacterium]|mgnify:CR=1 FL=1|jgi:ribosome-binding factor A|nr:30S ribosome-binding factor RbfA [Bacteroidales bacterium]MDI9593494.1 30S ribosome-binding factor RbfA [Bacteroidota bacterium]NLH33793.1 30S ribosome-binding factor RbfA [Lentimicrobium sp.]OQC37414.1 MAG: Ribosome-binding factor A [Bacteroidetes bacterium ADurb.Bin041]MBP7874438.1 30S ribosome-binding factor RbfA [Bacteroidales bacterium]
METKRQLRVSKLLQRELSSIFQRDAKDKYGSGMITVTKVNITKDLSIARVYLSLFATKDKAALLESIVQRTPEIRFTLGRAVKDQLRQIPSLEFYEDDSLDYIENIEQLLLP